MRSWLNGLPFCLTSAGSWDVKNNGLSACFYLTHKQSVMMLWSHNLWSHSRWIWRHPQFYIAIEHLCGVNEVLITLGCLYLLFQTLSTDQGCPWLCIFLFGWPLLHLPWPLQSITRNTLLWFDQITIEFLLGGKVQNKLQNQTIYSCVKAISFLLSRLKMRSNRRHDIFTYAEFDVQALCLLASKLRQGSACRCDVNQVCFNWAIYIAFDRGFE